MTAVAVGMVAGFVSGMLASMVGIGGAVVTTPAIRFAGATPLAAIGSTVPAIVPGALVGSFRYRREGLVDDRAALMSGGIGVLSAVAGGLVADVVDGRWLMIITGLMVLWSAVSLLRSSRAATDAVPLGAVAVEPLATSIVARPAAAILLGLGTVAGFLAGLLGVGGGIVLTPGLNLIGGLPLKRAIATSLTAVAMMSIASLVTHVRLGHVDWAYALPLVIGVVPGARVGARLTIGASDTRVRLTAGIVLAAVAVIYMGREIADLVG